MKKGHILTIIFTIVFILTLVALSNSRQSKQAETIKQMKELRGVFPSSTLTEEEKEVVRKKAIDDARKSLDKK